MSLFNVSGGAGLCFFILGALAINADLTYLFYNLTMDRLAKGWQ